MFTVYVLQNPDGRLYIGQTSDLDQRRSQHDAQLSQWTKSRGPWTLVHREDFPTRAEAMARERALKSGRRNQELRDSLKNSSHG